MRATVLALATGLMMGVGVHAGAAETVQIPLEPLLSARTVTTLTGGVLVPWTMGVDGGGTADGYMTTAASKFNNDPPTIKALPDDGRFPADARHPDVVLHFSNTADAASQQTLFVKGAGEFSFAVPAAQYDKLFLVLTSGEGGSALKVTLTYADATTDLVSQTLPDYYNPIAATDPVFFNLALDLAKWTKQSKIAETNHHYIDGMEIHPAPAKVLTRVTVQKTAGGYLVFWGATGVANSPVDGGTSNGGPDASDSGAVPGGSDGPTDQPPAFSDASSTGGSSGSGGGGMAGTGGRPGDDAGGAGGAGASNLSPSGCQCSLEGGGLTESWWMLLALGIVSHRWRRRDNRSLQ